MADLVEHLEITGQDAICDRLIKVVIGTTIPTETLRFPAPYQHLLAATHSKSEAESHLKKFLSAYYDKLDMLPWHDSHLKQAASFFGYWSFELAALVKAFHFSDHDFADNIFYPRDLVHQRMFRTWLDGAEGQRDRSEMDAALEDEDLQASVDFLGQYFKQHFGAKSEGLPADLDILSKLSAASGTELQENPEMMQGVIVQIMRSVLGAAGGLNKILDAAEKEGKNSSEMEAFIASIKENETDWQGAEIDADKLLAQLPPDAQAQLDGKVGKVPSEQLKAHYGKISNRLSEVLEKEQVDQLTFLEGLERLASDFGFALGEDPSHIAKEVSDKVSADLREQRKGRNLDNFDWSSLFEKKNGDES
ncbi:MAG TPA: DUF1911 domain-containing protein [Bacteroidetes bacterium]|nr:DUF1911 domain-containing protein [Bacteroidota bacterium]